jgi:lysophospholipase L1-like esterase
MPSDQPEWQWHFSFGRLSHATAWTVAVAASIASAASFSELQRMRARFREVTHYHFHEDVRQFAIKSALADLDRPIVIIGDSITEMARFPETIGGSPVVNAGIGGAGISAFLKYAPYFFEHSKPRCVAVALGTNDAGSTAIRRDYVELLRVLKRLSPCLLAVAIPPRDGSELINAEIEAAAKSEGIPFVVQQLPDGTRMPDQIHLNAAGYRIWTPTIVEAVFSAIRGS